MVLHAALLPRQHEAWWPSAPTSGRVYVWDVASGAEPRAIGEIDATWDTSHVLLNPDDDTVYTSTQDSLTAWDIDGGESLVERSTTRATPVIDAAVRRAAARRRRWRTSPAS